MKKQLLSGRKNRFITHLFDLDTFPVLAGAPLAYTGFYTGSGSTPAILPIWSIPDQPRQSKCFTE